MSFLANPILNPNVASQAAGVEFKVGTFDKSTAAQPASQSVTGVGFTPKALILFSHGSSATEDTIATQLSVAMGFTDGTTEKSISISSEDGLTGVSDSDRYSNSTKLLNLRAVGTGSLLAECDLTSFDADGFTLNWTTNSAFATKIKYVAIGGDDIEGVDVGTIDSATAIGVQNVSTSLNTADFLMLLSVNASAAQEDATTAQAIVSMGVASSDSNEGYATVSSQDGIATSNTQRHQRTNLVFGTGSVSSASTNREASFDGFTSSGFDLDWNKVGGSPIKIYYLTIKGGSWEVGNGTSPTSTTPQTKAYTTAFQPKGLMLFGYDSPADTAVKNGVFAHLGAADETNNAAIGIIDIDGVTTTDSSRISSDTKCVKMIANAPAEVIEEADLDSFNTADFTLDWTTTTTAAREFIWFVVGDE